MDFRSLILIAQQNSQAALQSAGKRKSADKAGYSTKFEPPKKQAKQAKQISANVQRFLQSQEQPKQKTSSSSNDGNSHQNKKQQVVAAADAALADSFESREANQIYERLLNKFDSVVVPDKKQASASRVATTSKKGASSDRSATKVDKSKAASVRVDTKIPAKPKGTVEVATVSKPAKSRAAPPALDFKTLLQLAEQNKAGTAAAASAVKSGPTRLLTEKEKRKNAQEKDRRHQTSGQPHSQLHPTKPKDAKLPSADTLKPKGVSSDHSKAKALPSNAPTSTASRPIPVMSNYFTQKATSSSSNSRHMPPPKRRHGRRVFADDDSSEYDSDMDDFIDDDNATEDYSAHIKEIFGYDKSRYSHIDHGDEPNMVSSFAQQMREEQISRKIGQMEDLEDMRAEAAADAEKLKRRKQSMKKHKAEK